jgi:hypothetical protein
MGKVVPGWSNNSSDVQFPNLHVPTGDVEGSSPFTFECPKTKLRVQGFLAEEVSYEHLRAGRMHRLHPSPLRQSENGHVLGEGREG